MGALRLPAWALAAAFGFVSLPTYAQISVKIPTECGDSAELERELRARLPESTRTKPISIALTPDAAGYHLLVRAADRERELQDRDCAALLRAAVVVTLALLAPSVTTKVPTTTAVPSTAPPPPKKTNHRFAIATDIGAHFGTTPKSSFLLGVEGELAWQRFGLALGLRYLFPTSTRDDEAHGVRADAIGALLAGTFSPTSRVQGRAGIAVYRLSGDGLGSRSNRKDLAWDAGPTLGLRFLPLLEPPFFAAVAAEGQWNVLRANFQIHEYGQVFEASRVSASTFLQVGLIW